MLRRAVVLHAPRGVALRKPSTPALRPAAACAVGRRWVPPCNVRVPASRRTACKAAGNGNGSSEAHLEEAARALPGVQWGLWHVEPGQAAPETSTSASGDLSEAYRSLDAVVVLAGGQTSATGVPPWVERRLDTALSLQRLQRKPTPILNLGTPHRRHSHRRAYRAVGLVLGLPCVALPRGPHVFAAVHTPAGGGTPHKAPYLDERGYVVHESTACCRSATHPSSPAPP
jgi:hypothetical protein